MHCIACGDNLSFFGARLGYEYHRCTQCRTIQLAPMPTEEELSAAYTTEYASAGHHEGDPEYRKRLARPYYECIALALQRRNVTGIVVDYGAGWGGLCELLRVKGFDCRGLEVSDEMLVHARGRGLPVEKGDAAALGRMRGVSAIVLCTVFEHLVNHRALLMAARDALRNDGLFISFQPTAGFAQFAGTAVRFGNLKRPLPQVHKLFAPPWHTSFFSLEGMARIASDSGFELLEIGPGPQATEKGVTGILQAIALQVNKVGWAMFRHSWPLLTSHLFLFRKI
jgi:SAM-dependent methyltransferase